MLLVPRKLHRFLANHLIWGSLFLALLINMFPIGQALWWPDVLLIVFLYWVTHYPNSIGLGTGFILGLVVDVQTGSLLGQHAFTYLLACYMAVAIHRRLLWFPLWQQSTRMLPLFLMAFACTLGLRLLFGGKLPNLLFFLVPFLQAILWPIISQLLMQATQWANRIQRSGNQLL